MILGKEEDYPKTENSFSYCITVSKITLSGSLGHFLCTVFITENFSYCAMYASIINLVNITVERYLKVVHPFWSKKYLKRWMIIVAMVFAWVGGTVVQAPVVFVTSFVENGICWQYFAWHSGIGLDTHCDEMTTALQNKHSTVHTTRPQRKNATRKHLENRFEGVENGDSRIQVQLEEDGGSS